MNSKDCTARNRPNKPALQPLSYIGTERRLHVPLNAALDGSGRQTPTMRHTEARLCHYGDGSLTTVEDPGLAVPGVTCQPAASFNVQPGPFSVDRSVMGGAATVTLLKSLESKAPPSTSRLPPNIERLHGWVYRSGRPQWNQFVRVESKAELSCVPEFQRRTVD